MIRATPEHIRRGPLWLERKMGFAPVIRCVCGASISTGKARVPALQAFCVEHEDCRRASSDISIVSAHAHEPQVTP